jgi:hypothetical protein
LSNPGYSGVDAIFAKPIVLTLIAVGIADIDVNVDPILIKSVVVNALYVTADQPGDVLE